MALPVRNAWHVSSWSGEFPLWDGAVDVGCVFGIACTALHYVMLCFDVLCCALLWGKGHMDRGFYSCVLHVV